MKKSIILSLTFLFLASLAFAQDKVDYSKFRTGTFSYPGQEEDVIITWTKHKQIEVYNGGESKLILKVEWLNDSTYLLTHKKSINAPGCLDKGDWIKTKITQVNGNRYLCESTTNKCGSGELIIVKLE